MLPFSRQIQLACDFAGEELRPPHAQRRAGRRPIPKRRFDELRQRLARTIDYLRTFKPAQFEGADARDVTFPVGADTT